MTDQTQPGKTAASDKKEGFTAHLPTIVAAAVGALIVSILSSFLGKAGTLIGLMAGSMLSGTVTWYTERGIRKSAAIAKAKRDAVRKKGRPLTLEETSVIERIADFKTHRRGIGWKRISVLSVLALVLSAGSVSAVEAMSGKTLHGLLTGTNDKGFSIGRDYAPSPTVTETVTRTASVPAVVPDETPSSSSPAVTSTPDATPDATPDETPPPAAPVTSDPVVSESATVTGSPSAPPSPQVTPTAAPTTP